MDDLRESIALIQKDVADTRADVYVIRQIVSGNGEPQKGLVIRVDRLEQRWSLVLWVLGGLSLPVLGAVGFTVWEVIKNS